MIVRKGLNLLRGKDGLLLGYEKTIWCEMQVKYIYIVSNVCFRSFFKEFLEYYWTIVFTFIVALSVFHGSNQFFQCEYLAT